MRWCQKMGYGLQCASITQVQFTRQIDLQILKKWLSAPTLALLHGDYGSILNAKGHCFCTLLTFIWVYLSSPWQLALWKVSVCFCKWLAKQWEYCRNQLDWTNFLYTPPVPMYPACMSPSSMQNTHISVPQQPQNKMSSLDSHWKVVKCVKSCIKSRIIGKKAVIWVTFRDFHNSPGFNSIAY